MFILMLYTSSFIWQPKNLTLTTFESREQCEQALSLAKEEWVTMNEESKCVDVALEAEIKAKRLELKKLKDQQ